MYHRRTIVLGSAVVLSLSLLATGLAPSALAGVSRKAQPTGASTLASPSSNNRYILRLREDADQGAVRTAVKRLNGTVIAFQQTMHTVVITAPKSALTKLSTIPGVTAVAPDAEVKAQSLGFDYSTQAGSMTNVTRVTGATEMWKKGFTGKGVDVALIDTGVAPVSGLNDSAKVVVGPDLSFESQDADTRYLDTYGHGSNMAGIIAGREVAPGTGAAYAADTSNFYGMAPDARIVSVKMADHSGAVDVSQMIAALDWVVTNRWSNGQNIRVVNISYGTISKQNAQADPLSWAAEVAWKYGMVVVASAGNDGDSTPGLASPAYNPWVVAVGAEDAKGTSSYSDDTVPSFSQQGVNGGRAPDVVAPGVGVISLGVPGSNIYQTYPAAHIGNGFIRGSGTSQAAAVVSGAAALLLSEWPGMNPDDVKLRLRSKATKLSGVSGAAQGAGALNLRTTDNSYPQSAPAQSAPLGNGNGTLEAARGGQYVQLNGTNLTGEKDVMGNPWSSKTMSAAAASYDVWSTWDGMFNGATWIGTGGMVADTTSWAGRTWGGKTYQSAAWTGRTWSGRTWSSATWQGRTWSSASWSSPVAEPSWAGRTWSSTKWG